MPTNWRFLRAIDLIDDNDLNPDAQAMKPGVLAQAQHASTVRCDCCDGIGHTAGGTGSAMERKLSSCPNPWILKKRVGKSQASKAILKKAREKVNRKQVATFGEGYNGGAQVNGRRLGNYNAFTHITAVIARWEIYRHAHAPQGAGGAQDGANVWAPDQARMEHWAVNNA